MGEDVKTKFNNKLKQKKFNQVSDEEGTINS
jgi:hypothetical protein